jgi:uncharacterized membrane protein
MGSLSNAKILGGIGSLLSLIGVFIPSTFGILSLIGFILVFIAVKMIADATKESGIFNNFLFSFILCIIAIVAALFIGFITLSSVGGLQFFMDLQNLAMSNPTDPMVIWNAFQPVITGILTALFVAWIIIVLSIIFLRKSFNRIAEVTNVKWFGTAALLFLIGAVSLIIIIGILILIIAMIIEIVAFFSLPDELPGKTN